MIKALCSTVLLLLYRKYDLFWGYANLSKQFFPKAAGVYANYALYKSGFIEIDKAVAYSRSFRFINRSLYIRLASIKSPELFLSRLPKEEQGLIKNNWGGINDYLKSYELVPFVGDIPWTTKSYCCSRKIESEDLVSIIMTVRNSVNTIGYAIRSVLSQTYSNIELIIVDDFSTDGTVDLVEDFALSDTRIRLIKQKKNYGAYKSRNLALSYARGKYITTHDADDLMHPQRIELMLVELQKDQTRIAAVSYWVRFTEDGFVSLKRGIPLLRMNLSSFMFKKEVVKDLRWDEHICGADLFFFSECLHKYGKKAISIIRKPLSISLFSDNSLTASSVTGVFSKEGRTLRSKYEYCWRMRLLKKYHPKIHLIINYLEHFLEIHT